MQLMQKKLKISKNINFNSTNDDENNNDYTH